MHLDPRIRQPGDLGVLREVFHGFSEEARTCGFPSPSLGGFGFIGYDELLCWNDQIGSIGAYTYFYIMMPKQWRLWVVSGHYNQY